MMLILPAILAVSAPLGPPVSHVNLRIDFATAMRSIGPARADAFEPRLDAAAEQAIWSAEPEPDPKPVAVPLRRLLEVPESPPAPIKEHVLLGDHPDLPSLADLARLARSHPPLGLRITIDPLCYPH